MEFKSTTNPATFLEQTQSFLINNEAANSLILGLAQMSQDRLAPVQSFVALSHGKIGFAVFQTPPVNLILTSAPDLSYVRKFAELPLVKTLDFSGLVGPVHEVTLLAESFSEIYGWNFRLAAKQRIYACEKVVMPKPRPGAMAFAEETHLPLVLDWMVAFAQEAVPHDKQDREALKARLPARLARPEMALWVEDGEPKALACLSRETMNGITINYVYTPPALRGRGYASQLVAHLTQNVLGRGKKMAVLYTDLNNPTSNSIYQNIGYKSVADSIHLIRI